jgi:hypothetical protein
MMSHLINRNELIAYYHLLNLHFHTLAVLPVVRRRELGIARIIMMATESIMNLHMLLVGSCCCCFCFGDSASIGPLGTLDVTVWTVAILIVLAVGVVLRSQMPIQ